MTGSMAERRRKHTALKDVAGILRSFDYAAAAAARTVAELPAVQLQDFERLFQRHAREIHGNAPRSEVRIKNHAQPRELRDRLVNHPRVIGHLQPVDRVAR